MKKALINFGVIVLVAAAAAAGFYGGMQYQGNKAEQARANFEQARGQIQSGQFSPEAGGFPGPGGLTNSQAPGQRGGVVGQVKTIDGNILTISTAEDVTTVNLSDTTRVQKNAQVPISELQPGMQVMVSGQKDADGGINASQIMILNESAGNPPYPAP